MEGAGVLSSLAKLREGLVKDVAFEKTAMRSEESHGHVSLFPAGKVTCCTDMQDTERFRGQAFWASPHGSPSHGS